MLRPPRILTSFPAGRPQLSTLDCPGSMYAERGSVADVVERLMGQFGDRVGLRVISGVVLRCREDLSGAPAGAIPELLERLARQRLLDVTLLTPPQGAGRAGS